MPVELARTRYIECAIHSTSCYTWRSLRALACTQTSVVNNPCYRPNPRPEGRINTRIIGGLEIKCEVFVDAYMKTYVHHRRLQVGPMAWPSYVFTMSVSNGCLKSLSQCIWRQHPRGSSWDRMGSSIAVHGLPLLFNDFTASLWADEADVFYKVPYPPGDF